MYLKGECIEKVFFKMIIGSIMFYMLFYFFVDGDLKFNFGNFMCIFFEMEIVDEKKEMVMK